MQGQSKNERADDSLKFKIQSLITNVEVKQKVLEKLESQNITHPCLKLEIVDCDTVDLTIDEPDVMKVFECFGQVASLKINGKNAVIEYKDLVSAYFAITILDGKELPELNVTLQVSWFTPAEPRTPLKELNQVLSQDSTNTSDENLKYTCRFDIQIDNDKEFQVARRLIGPKGSNMKRIIDKCCKGINGQAHDIIKLRLRGIGSGFKEGPNNTESQDRLHLCISSKYHNKFILAVGEIEKLLKSVYREYRDFCIAKGKTDPQLELVKSEKTSGRSLMLAPSRFKEIEENERLCDDDIEELIDVRNEARRQCNFMEADRIRELLRKKGITLMDEKGRRGRGVEVTTWKYGKN